MRSPFVPRANVDQQVRYDVERHDVIGCLPSGSQRILDVGCSTGRFDELPTHGRTGGSTS